MMSSQPANTSFVRTRSVRAAGNSLRPTVSVSQQPTGISNPSSVRILFTNLRLLSLHDRDDWPNVTELTFSLKDTQQNQKKRIQHVEWILYTLFALWNPDEARIKLQPFFPPLEPLQSLNLRAALFRSLDQLKKDGVLGRDAILRKTMLDECKGDRLEDVLATFSTAVLKRITTESENYIRTSIGSRLALENVSYSSERTTLAVIGLAYKYALGKQLRERAGARTKYLDFRELLELRERQIRRRLELLNSIANDQEFSKVSTDQAERLFEALRQNWSSEPQWLETFTKDDAANMDLLLKSPYDMVWAKVVDGNVGEIEHPNEKNLIEKIRSRVKHGQHRLSKWQQFENKIPLGAEESKVTRNTQNVVLALDFSAHTSMQLGENLSDRQPRRKPSTRLQKYEELLRDLESQMGSVAQACDRKRVQRVQRQNIFRDKDIPRVETSANISGSSTISACNSDKHTDSVDVQTITPTITPSPPHTEAPPSPDASVELANRILKSVSNASPSPTKPRHILSLAERTRMSMSRMSLLDEPADLPSPSLRQSRAITPRRVDVHDDELADSRGDLVERTRKSMSSFAAAQKRAQLEKRRSVRAAARKQRDSTYFPRVEEEGQERSLSPELPVDKEDTDYESVFKSRPRIKHSPSASPTKIWDNDPDDLYV